MKALTPLLVEHLKDNEGELLPNLLLGDVMRWLLEHHRDEEDTCREVFACWRIRPATARRWSWG